MSCLWRSWIPIVIWIQKILWILFILITIIVVFPLLVAFVSLVNQTPKSKIKRRVGRNKTPLFFRWNAQTHPPLHLSMYFSMRFYPVAASFCPSSLSPSCSFSSSKTLSLDCLQSSPLQDTDPLQLNWSSTDPPRPSNPSQALQSTHPPRSTSNQQPRSSPWISPGATFEVSRYSCAYPRAAWAPFFCLSPAWARRDIPLAAPVISVSPLGSSSPIPWLSEAVYSHR